jgi:hypothetical protein
MKEQSEELERAIQEISRSSAVMNTISLRPLRWQLGVTAMLALLCALGTGIG